MSTPAEDRAVVALGRCAATIKAIQRRRLFVGSRHLYGSRQGLLRRDYEHLWPFADAWSAVEALASIPGQKRASAVADGFLDGLTAYSRKGKSSLLGTDALGFESTVIPPLGTGGDVYFDDNAWVALALMKLHDRTGERLACALARRILSFILSGWSHDSTWSHPGGIRWKQPTSNTSRNTCSNAPVAELAALIHEQTGDREMLEWATRIYRWVRSALLRTDGLYADQIAPDGTVNPAIWSYNQGTMIGAGALLHRITGEPAYMEEALSTTSASMRHFDLQALLTQDAAFNAVYFRNLLLRAGFDGDTQYMASAEEYADAMWMQARDRRSGLFRGKGSVLNSTAPMIEIYALVAGAAPSA